MWGLGYLVEFLVLFGINSKPSLGREGAWIIEKGFELEAGNETAGATNAKGSNVWGSVETSIVGL